MALHSCMHGACSEAETRPNLGKAVAELLDGAADGPVLLTVNDKKLNAPLRVRLRLK